MAVLPQRSAAIKPHPRLVVLLVAEQFRPDYLDSARDHLIAGGLRRLLEGGAYYPDCRHTASTFSSTAMATLATGAWPALHGIVADRWYDRAAKRVVPASDEALLATTLAAQVASTPRRRVFVVGPDAAAVRLFAGTGSASRYWVDDQGQFTTTSEPPDWLTAYNRQKPIDRFRDARWMAVGARPDAAALRTLTFDPSHPADFLALYHASPFGQMAQFEFLVELIQRERLGRDASDFLCILSGATARLGYETGASSPLMQQMVLHFDRHVEMLFDQLNRTPGEGAYNVIFTAAHGAPPLPAPESRARMAVNGEALAQSIQKALGPAGPRLEKYVYPFLYLDAAARDSDAVRLHAARAAMSASAAAGYYTAGGVCSAPPPWSDRYRNSFHPQRSGDVMLSYRPEYVEDYGGRGISYGSLYNYDVRVPLCFYGPQFRAGTFERTVYSVDVAPTLARALEVAMPSTGSGHVLGDAFAPNVKSNR